MENSYLFYEQTVFPITTILACHADFSSFTQSYLLFSKLIVYFLISTPLVLSFLGNDLPHPPPDSVLYFSSSNLNSSINVNLNSHVKCIFHFWENHRVYSLCIWLYAYACLNLFVYLLPNVINLYS